LILPISTLLFYVELMYRWPASKAVIFLAIPLIDKTTPVC
jgi:hypothetical protein